MHGHPRHISVGDTSDRRPDRLARHEGPDRAGRRGDEPHGTGPRPPWGTRPPPLVAMPVPPGRKPVVLRGTRQAVVALLRMRGAWRRCKPRYADQQGGIPRGRADHRRSVRDRGPLGRKPPAATASKPAEDPWPPARGTVRFAPGRCPGPRDRGRWPPLDARGREGPGLSPWSRSGR